MASLVSSERAFSQGGITISKRRNRLKGDIVEALQCLKCAIRHDLLFQEAAPSSAVEEELEELDTGLIDVDPGPSEDEIEESGWDDILLVEDEDGNTEYEGDIESDTDTT